jgi:hypothetical protein
LCGLPGNRKSEQSPEDQAFFSRGMTLKERALSRSSI